MLYELDIDNIAVIKRAAIEFTPGFTVLTGETGAGKSIIIDSIMLLLGGRAQKDMVRAGEASASVSAAFGALSKSELELIEQLGIAPDEDGMIYLRRDITSEGKASARINGRTAPTSTLRDIGAALVNIHGQHDNQELLNPASHLSLVDLYADDHETLSAYAAVYDELAGIRRELAAVSVDESEKERRAEMLRYQLSDIDTAKLKPGEEEALEARRLKLRNLELISRQSRLIYRALYRADKGLSAYDLISRSSAALEQLREFVPDSDKYLEKLEAMRAELEDIAERVADACGGELDTDPTVELDRIESRLDSITKLKRKYGADINEILAFRAKVAGELAKLENSEERLSELKKELAAKESEAKAKADALTAVRFAASERLSAAVTSELAELELQRAVFSVRLTHMTEPDGGTRYTKRGADDVEFLITANPGEPPKSLAKIASGGELSRVMLAIKSVLSEGGAQTLIFDEIDAGVSGKTSYKIGVKLKKLAKSAQVICVTHSAQIAAVADAHLFISKRETDGRVETAVTPLGRELRIRELARIMGGAEITDKLLLSAEELLESGKQ
jgi:DNA repair protein RecN